jgi:hypothetical protein
MLWRVSVVLGEAWRNNDISAKKAGIWVLIYSVAALCRELPKTAMQCFHNSKIPERFK